jgi:DNA polymerase III sliding clamp (beta) subunit (PCNA family)
MKINKQKLQTALDLVKPGLANKEQIEQSTSFAFIDGCVKTFNDEISVSHPIKDLQLEGAVNADEFYKLISKIKKDEIEMDVTENEIHFKSSRTKAGLTLQNEILLPIESIGKRGKWMELPEDFLRYISLAVGACSNAISRPILTCVNIQQDGKIIGADLYKIMICQMETDMPIDSFLLPAKSVLDVLKLNPVKIAQGDGWIHFQTKEKTEISCRIFEDEYPDISPYEAIEGISLSFPKTMQEILERAWVFAKRDVVIEESVIISFAENRMKIRAESETGWIEDEVNVKYNDDPVEFSITPYLLRDILKETNEFILSDNALKFEGTGWQYISALCSTAK